MRPSKTIEEELEHMREGILILLKDKYALEFVDLMHIAKQSDDLKRELRIAKVNER